MEVPRLTIALDGGRQITGSLVNGSVEWRGRKMDARDIIAMDHATLFLFGAVQLDVAAEDRPALKGFLELDVAGEGQVTLPIHHVKTILRHPS